MEYVKCMGGLWLERNIPVFLNHVLNLVGSPKATPTHVDAVYARKCVLFILRSTIGALLGEKAQIAAAKEISQIIIKQMNAVGKFYFSFFCKILNNDFLIVVLSVPSVQLRFFFTWILFLEFLM